MICDVLGIPRGDEVTLRGWSRAITQTLEPIMTDAEVDAAIDAVPKMDDYLVASIEAKRAEPGEDLLTKLVEVEEDGDRLTSDELVSMVGLLFVAGHETTVNLIGNGTLALLRNPDQLELVRATDEHDAMLADELLRYDSPVQTSGRIVKADVEVLGKAWPAGTPLLTSLGSANHDRDVFGPDAAFARYHQGQCL